MTDINKSIQELVTNDAVLANNIMALLARVQTLSENIQILYDRVEDIESNAVTLEKLKVHE